MIENVAQDSNIDNIMITPDMQPTQSVENNQEVNAGNNFNENVGINQVEAPSQNIANDNIFEKPQNDIPSTPMESESISIGNLNNQNVEPISKDPVVGADVVNNNDINIPTESINSSNQNVFSSVNSNLNNTAVNNNINPQPNVSINNNVKPATPEVKLPSIDDLLNQANDIEKANKPNNSQPNQFSSVFVNNQNVDLPKLNNDNKQ